MSRWIFRFAQNDTPRTWAGCLLLLAAAVAAYHNSLHGPFVFDDASSIETNPTIRRLWPLTDVLAGPVTNVTAQGRPLLNLSLALNYAVHGTAVEGYHVVNLGIHALAGLALFGLVRRLLKAVRPTEPARATWLACVIALLWTVHPLQTESVTYVIQRAESLVGLFYLLTLYGFVRAVDFHVLRENGLQATGWCALSVTACMAGMATKEVMATAPVMVLLCDRTFFAGTFRAAWRQRWRFYAALASTWLLLGVLIAQTGGNRGGSVGFGVAVRAWEYWLTQFKAIGHYVWLACWPHPLVFEYGAFWIHDFGEVVFGLAVVLGLGGWTLLLLARRSPWGFAGAWFFGVLAPTSLAPGTTQMMVEHRMYLPLAALIAVVVCLVERCLVARRPHLMVCAAATACALALLTVRRNADYRSDLSLWTDTVSKRPENPLAHFMLAGVHERAGRIAAAQASFERTLELKPDFSIGHENLGELLLKQGRRADAIAHFQSALRLQPGYADAHANLGNAYLEEGRIADAVAHLERATQLAPQSPVTRYNYGNALVAAGLPGEAVVEYEAAVQMRPDYAEAQFNLANALVALERPAEARAHYEAAVKARPAYAEAHYNLGNLLAASGQPAEAIAHYEAALRARPDYPDAHHNLGSALFELGRLADAATHYEETLRLAPDFPNARANLERVRAQMKR